MSYCSTFGFGTNNMSYTERTLLIRHLPSDLGEEKRIDLLQHFGATRVKLMSINGFMKHTAFATFEDSKSANQALERLHQLEVCGVRLLAEFAKPSQSHNFPHEGDITEKPVDKAIPPAGKNEREELLPRDRVKQMQDEVFAKFGIDYPRHPGLTYLYPPPSVSTLTNIAHDLASHPKFYVQVLHLMNKLNLPVPFGPATHSPPIPIHGGIPPPDNMVVCVSEESEIDSDPDIKSKDSVHSLKRPMKRSSTATKRPKYIPPPLPAPVREPTYVTPTPSDVFDTRDSTLHKPPVLLNLPPTVTTHIHQDQTADVSGVSSVGETEVGRGFGKIEPQKHDSGDTSEDSTDEVQINPTQFVSLSHIKANRISTSEMKNFASFKNYAPGDPSSRIYIKNLSRKSTEVDLINLFGSYADYDTEEGRSMFYVQLMEGRMKGQAFVTLVSPDRAQSAVRDVNGYVLQGKPIVVQFARTAKPKDTNEQK